MIEQLTALPLALAQRMDKAITAGSLANASAAARDNDRQRALRAVAGGPGNLPGPARSA